MADKGDNKEQVKEQNPKRELPARLLKYPPGAPEVKGIEQKGGK